MKRRILVSFALLALAAFLIAAYQGPDKAQAVAPDKRIQLGPYGTVLSLPSPNGQDSVALQHEGFALTYQFKHPKTGQEEIRFVYAIGSQQASSSLLQGKVSGTIATLRTQDGILEITSVVECEKGQPCKLTRSFKNISPDRSVLIKIVQAEAVIDANRILGNYRGVFTPGQNCGDPCPPGVCGGLGQPPCQPPDQGPNWPFLNYAELRSGLPFRLGIMGKSEKQVVALNWIEGVNAKFAPLKFGQEGRMVLAIGQ